MLDGGSELMFRNAVLNTLKQDAHNRQSEVHGDFGVFAAYRPAWRVVPPAHESCGWTTPHFGMGIHWPGRSHGKLPWMFRPDGSRDAHGLRQFSKRYTISKNALDVNLEIPRKRERERKRLGMCRQRKSYLVMFARAS